LLLAGSELGSLPCVPSDATLTKDVDPAAATADGAQAIPSTSASHRLRPTQDVRRRKTSSHRRCHHPPLSPSLCLQALRRAPDLRSDDAARPTCLVAPWSRGTITSWQIRRYATPTLDGFVGIYGKLPTTYTITHRLVVQAWRASCRSEVWLGCGRIQSR